jgi:ArsR family transcriptional regulator, arsenate/arsenite/antimonite-responsive transcriptional repressor
MEKTTAIAGLSALAQVSWLDVFRLLVQAGKDGLAAGQIAAAGNVQSNTLSFHLNRLHNAGLITRRRVSRSLIYTADYAAMDALLAYLTESCCAGRSAARELTLGARGPARKTKASKTEMAWRPEGAR